MRRHWSGAAVAAVLLASALGACASNPHYPIEEGEARGPAPLSAPHPQYAIEQPTATAADSAASPTAAAAPATPPVQPSAAPPPAAPPVASVETQSLPPPAGAAPSPAVDTSAPPPATPVSDTSAPPAEEPAMTPQAVSHDAPTAPPSAPAPAEPVRVASATPSTPSAPLPGYTISGRVVDAQGIFENYEVQRGDHVDALARAFATTRDLLLDANHIHAPYVIVPGQIIKVPVAKAYIAVSGDTLGGVARRFSVNVGELAQLNHLSEHAPLTAGEQVGLPSSMRDTGPIRDYSDYARNNTGSYTSHSTYTPTPSYRVSQVTPAQPPPSVDHGTNYATPQPPAQSQAPSMTDSQIAQAAHGRFVWPVRGDILARFGPQGVGRRNDGVDIRAPSGTPVKAAAPGEVVYAGDQVPGFGNLVLIKHADGWVTAYAHLDHIDVQMKQQVTQGQVVGAVGASGGVAEPELHFEVRFAPNPEDKARPVDPVLVLPSAG